MNFPNSQSDESLHPHFHQISPQLHCCCGLQRSTSSPHLRHQIALESLRQAYAVRSWGVRRALSLIEPLCQRRRRSHNCTGQLLGSRVQQFREREHVNNHAGLPHLTACGHRNDVTAAERGASLRRPVSSARTDQ